MRMTQEEASSLCAQRMSLSVNRFPLPMQRLETDLANLETIKDALDFFRGEDDDIHSSIVDLRNHHLLNTKRTKDRKRKFGIFDWAGANASWRMAREAFSVLALRLASERTFGPEETHGILEKSFKLILSQ